ncbi:DUF4390 domain-containing protein [Massilia sp. CCM 8694]|uniref:DUF4390 domain-containing protein n=2 Tax=Massilia genomosp. 1 TaxID=2609280 RepID=A0ABX0MDN3_9BURK|nr:DUF4390 domain-containing protein [Massilia genomosp. 1]NHZ60886.1 DUF4390 domain-containing protein [Massilia genomosp. 1]
MFASACAFGPARAAEVVDITHAHIEATDEGYRLAASYAFELNEGLEDAIKHGVQLYFTTEIELTRPRWYWYDDKAVSARQTIRIWYNVLTRQYHVSVLGSMAQSFPTLEDAMVLIRRPSRWVIAPKAALKRGETYNVTVRMFMDRELLPKPMQVNALNNSDWRLASKNKTFPYTAE